MPPPLKIYSHNEFMYIDANKEITSLSSKHLLDGDTLFRTDRFYAGNGSFEDRDYVLNVTTPDAEPIVDAEKP